MPQLTIRIVIFSVFLVSTCLGRIHIETTGPEEIELVEAAVQVIKSCYKNRVTPVGLAGNLTGAISKAMSHEGGFPVTLIEADSRIVKNRSLGPQSRYKLQVFVVTVSSPLGLERTLKEIKASIWWNHMANFLILHWSGPSNDDGCSRPFELLWTAWNMNLLNANLICYNSHLDNRLIYTFNPYKNQAPQSWKLVKIYNGQNNHPWSLFVRNFSTEQKLCDELDFEKALDLDGYEIRVSVANTSLGGQFNPSNICVSPVAEIVCRLFFPALKATAKVILHNSSDAIGYIDNKGKAYGIMGEVANGTSDFSAMPRPITSMGNSTYSYPLGQSEIRAMTQYSGYKSQMSKIIGVIDRTSRLGLCLVILTTVIFFKIFLGQTLSRSLMSTIRLICNSSLLSIPNTLVSRFYLGSLFVFIVTMQGIYQGKLASLLTNEQSLPNVDTMKDLIVLGHTIYGAAAHYSYFNIPDLKGRYVSTINEKCTEYVLRDSKAACVAQRYIIIRDIIKYKLHWTRDALIRVSGVIPIRPDWPLENRFNTLGMRLYDSYHVEYITHNVSSKILRLIDIQEKEYLHEGIKVLTMEHLFFAFAILGIGTVFAIVSFIVEIIFYKNQDDNKH